MAETRRNVSTEKWNGGEGEEEEYRCIILKKERNAKTIQLFKSTSCGEHLFVGSVDKRG